MAVLAPSLLAKLVPLVDDALADCARADGVPLSKVIRKASRAVEPTSLAPWS
jgi:hypothetical protein